MAVSNYFLYRNIIEFYFIEVLMWRTQILIFFMSTKSTCSHSKGYREQGKNGIVASVMLCYVIKMPENYESHTPVIQEGSCMWVHCKQKAFLSKCIGQVYDF